MRFLFIPILWVALRTIPAIALLVLGFIGSDKWGMGFLSGTGWGLFVMGIGSMIRGMKE